jgi:hypothetical protein
MTALNNLSVAQLREAVAIKEQIEQFETQLASIFGGQQCPKLPVKSVAGCRRQAKRIWLLRAAQDGLR